MRTKNDDAFVYLQEGKNITVTLRKRAENKYFSQKLMVQLAALQSPLEKQYWKSYHCSQDIVVNGHRAKSHYCTKRWCVICNRIRTAQLHTIYKDAMTAMVEPMFVTLTVKNCEEYRLKPTMEKMYKDFVKIKDLARKNSHDFNGLRKLEITYNRRTDEYHPHFHLLLGKRTSAEFLLDGWLEKNPTADIAGQQVEDADQNTLFELFKYFAKLTGNSKKDNFVSIKPLDIICQSTVGVRVFQTFGNFKGIEPTFEQPAKNLEAEAHADIYKWDKVAGDWLNEEDGDYLTGYVPTEKQKDFKNVPKKTAEEKQAEKMVFAKKQEKNHLLRQKMVYDHNQRKTNK